MRKLVAKFSFKRWLIIGSRKNLVTFFFALIVATFFWFIKSFDQQYSREILLRIDYINLPSEKVSKYPLPKFIKVKIKTDGWHLFVLSNQIKNDSLVIDLLNFNRKKSVSSSAIKNLIQTKVSSKVIIGDFFPNFINLEFDKMFSKVVPVEPDLMISFAKFTGLSGPVKVEPETIVISGPESEVKKVKVVSTKLIKLNNLGKSIKTDVFLLQIPNLNIGYSCSKVNVLIPVEQLTEGEMIIPITFFSQQTDSISLIPDKVKVKYQVAISNFDKVNSSLFKAVYDPSEIWNKNPTLKVNIEVASKYIYKVKSDPEYIDYIITK